MKTLLAGIIIGLVIATVGFGGVARILDKGVETVKTKSQELAQ